MEDIIVAICKLALAIVAVTTMLVCTGIIVAGCIWIGKCLIMGAC